MNLDFNLLQYNKVTRNPPGDPRYWFRHRSKDSWTLSTVDNSWASSDSSAEVIKVSTSLFLLQCT